MGVRRSPPPALPFDTLPERSSPSSQVRRARKTPHISQPDLLDWQPPVTHLTAEDVGAVMLDAVAFRPPAGETFLYALIGRAEGQAILEGGLSLADRLIQFWLEVAHEGHGPCYVLVAKDPSGR
ncbi:hypothetical protein [Gluconobacter cerinus]|uniref:Uncharacterized protein n=1 Tax=Gluconobacter cerinus TaxID=38307 RepID=A0A1B6VJ41_9PROT|nr:hypothetical protein [Gluconobacter cerinus]OAJ67245.1 hypothetical protein A0123_01841 [Gluconobacter cerinus]